MSIVGGRRSTFILGLMLSASIVSCKDYTENTLLEDFATTADGGSSDEIKDPTPTNDNTNSTPKNASWTKGSGGDLGEIKNGQFGQGGKFVGFVPQDNSAAKAHGLLILLHGSTASSYREFISDIPEIGMKKVAADNGLIPISVLAPNGQGWNETSGPEAVQYLESLIQNKLYKEYNIDRNLVFFSGQSSGGGFLSNHFVPLAAKNYRGGAFFQCGLNPPDGGFQPSEKTKKSFRLHIKINSDDPIWKQFIGATVVTYRNAGMTVTPQNPATQTPGNQHCDFNQSQTIADNIKNMISANAAANPESESGQASSEGNSAGSKGTSGEKGKILNALNYDDGSLKSEYRVWAPSSNSATTSHPLVVYLHGNTASNYGPADQGKSISGAHGQPLPTLDQARSEAQAGDSFWNNHIFVSILSPSFTNDQVRSWVTDQDAARRKLHANYVASLVDNEILKKYNVDLSKIYFVGQSGGGVFLGSTFVPLYGNKYKGGAMMLCGADQPDPSYNFTPSVQFKSSFKIHMHTTSRELNSQRYPLVSWINRGRTAYSALLGSPKDLSFANLGDGEHCIFRTGGQSPQDLTQPSIIKTVIGNWK